MAFRPTIPRPQPTPLAEALKGYLASAGLTKRLERVGVMAEWAGLVGPQIARVTQPESVTADGILRVRVATPAWASELSLMTPIILAKVNAGRTGRIRSIRWHPAGIPRHDP